MITRACLVFAFSFLMSAFGLQAQTRTGFNWLKVSQSQLDNFTTHISISDQNDVAVAGAYLGTWDLDGQTIINNGSYDGFIIHGDQNGTTLWSRFFGGIGSDSVKSVAYDSNGNLLVCGYFSETVSFGSEAGQTLTSSGESDIFVMKLDTDGNLIWLQQFGGMQADRANNLVVDATGELYMTGYVTSPATLGSVALTDPNGQREAFVMNLDGNGVILWTEVATGTGNDVGRYLALDSGGNLYWYSNFIGDINVGGISYSNTADSHFVAKLATDTGNIIWVQGDETPYRKRIFGISVHSNGNVLLLGNFYGGFSMGGALASETGAYLVSLSPVDGNAVNQAFYPEYKRNLVSDLDIDNNGNIFIAGNFIDDFPLGSNLILQGQRDGYIAKLDGSLNLLWIHHLPAIQRAAVNEVDLTTENELILAGSFDSLTSFGDCQDFSTSFLGTWDIYWGKMSESRQISSQIELISPENGAQTTEGSPTLSWSDLEPPFPVSFTIEISTDFTFSNPIVVSGISDSIYTLDFPLTDGTYYWRIKATNPCGDPVPYSDIFSFDINTQVAVEISAVTLKETGKPLSVNGTIDFDVETLNRGAVNVDALLLEIDICKPGENCDVFLPVFTESIPLLAVGAGTSNNFSFSDTPIVGSYVIQARLKSVSDGYVYSENTTTASVGTPQISSFLTIGASGDVFLPGAQPEFEVEVSNSNNQTYDLQLELKIFDGDQNEVQCIAGTLTSLGKGRFTEFLIASALPSGSYTATVSATTGMACSGAVSSYSSSSLPFTVSELLLGSINAPDPVYTDQHIAIQASAENLSVAPLMDLNANLTILDPAGFVYFQDQLFLGNLPSGATWILDFVNIPFATNADVGLYEMSLTVTNSLGSLASSSSGLQVLQSIAISKFTAVAGKGGRSDQIKISKLEIDNFGESNRSLNVCASVAGQSTCVPVTIIAGTLARLDTITFTGLDPGTYEVLAQVSDGSENIATATQVVTLQ